MTETLNLLKELTEAHHRKELELIASRLPRTDIIITTAQIPGKKAPVLITGEMVKSLKPGSVIVDMAVEGGGNCELTEYDATVVRHGVSVIGKTNLPSLMPVHASQMYSKNIHNLINHLTVEGGLQFDMEDPITSGVVVTQGGSIVHPALLGA